MGLINTNGDSLSALKYDRIGEFSEGLACVLLSEKVGYIDRYGNEVIPLTYSGSEEELARFKFTQGLAVARKGKKYGVIDKTGTELKPFEFDLIDPVKDGRFAAKKKDRFGFFNTSGTDVIPAKYDDTHGFAEGMAAVKVGESWGYVNDANELVIAPQFSEAEDFMMGVAIVERGDFKCLIDKNGKTLIPCAIDEVILIEGDVLRLEKEEKMAYFDLRTKRYMWQAIGF
jgi:hypothetical protein